ADLVAAADEADGAVRVALTNADLVIAQLDARRVEVPGAGAPRIDAAQEDDGVADAVALRIDEGGVRVRPVALGAAHLFAQRADRGLERRDGGDVAGPRHPARDLTGRCRVVVGRSIGLRGGGRHRWRVHVTAR